MNDSEYQALRAEILGWQGHRITIATWTVVVVTAVLGWIIQAPHRWAWADGSSILMATLASAAILTRFLGLNALRLGTYLEVFHERDDGWESRNKKFREGRTWQNLNTGIAIIYTALGAVSIAVPILATDRTPSAGSYVVFALAVCLAGGAIILLLVMPGERDQHVKRWEALRDEEQEQAGTA